MSLMSLWAKEGPAAKTEWWPVLVLVAALSTVQAISALAHQPGVRAIDPIATISP